MDNHAQEAVSHERNKTDEDRHVHAVARVEIADVGNLVADHALQLLAVERSSIPAVTARAALEGLVPTAIALRLPSGITYTAGGAMFAAIESSSTTSRSICSCPPAPSLSSRRARG